RQLCRVEFEEHGGFAAGLVVIQIGDAVVQLVVKIGFDLVGFLGGSVGTVNGVASPIVSARGLFVRSAQLALVFFQSFLCGLLVLVHFTDLGIYRIGLLSDVPFRGAATRKNADSQQNDYNRTLHRNSLLIRIEFGKIAVGWRNERPEAGRGTPKNLTRPVD